MHVCVRAITTGSMPVTVDMATMGPECILDVGAELGEGPIWMAKERAVWFVDIKGRRIHRYHEPTGAHRSWTSPEEVGFIVPSAGGQFIVGLRSGLHRFNAEKGTFTLLAAVDSDLPHNRLNDGFVDAADVPEPTMMAGLEAPSGRLGDACLRRDVVGKRRGAISDVGPGEARSRPRLMAAFTRYSIAPGSDAAAHSNQRRLRARLPRFQWHVASAPCACAPNRRSS